jgi:hypothetical protein
MLTKQVDPVLYERVSPAIKSVRWTREQRKEDLRQFLNLALDSLEGIVPQKEGEK